MRLYASGSNGAGQLGLGHLDDVTSFTSCELETEVLAMASGGSHTLLLVREGSKVVLLGSGSNALGQLGSGPDRPRFTPLSIPDGPEGFSPTLIACAWTTSYIVYRSTNTSQQDVLVALGSNDFNELGDGLDLQAGDFVQSITSGQRHVVCVIQNYQTVEQRVVGWGAARHGQLSAPDYEATAQSQTSRGKAKALPRSIATPVAIGIPPDETIKKVAVGSTHTVYLTENGRVLSAGSDAKSQRFGLPGKEDFLQDISCTWNGTYCQVLRDSGPVIVSSGSNTHGQLGREDAVPGQLVQLPEHEANLHEMICGSEHLLAVLSPDRCLYVCGWNEHGNLGLGDKINRPQLMPVAVVEGHGEVKGVHAGCGTSFVWFHS